jgi:hypothetical protein
LRAAHFVCPHPDCGVDAQQNWRHMQVQADKKVDSDIMRATCQTCGQHSYWVGDLLAWPALRLGPPASSDFTDELLELYNEARAVATHSHRAAAGLLRLLIEKLISTLGAEGRTMFERIGHLADRGDISRRTVDALDVVRVVGNNALHEGQIDPDDGDDQGSVLLLFAVVNSIMVDAVTLPRQAAELLGDKRRAPK